MHQQRLNEKSGYNKPPASVIATVFCKLIDTLPHKDWIEHYRESNSRAQIR